MPWKRRDALNAEHDAVPVARVGDATGRARGLQPAPSILAAGHPLPSVRWARRLIHFALQLSEQTRNLVDCRQMLANSRFRNRFNHLFEITGNLDQFSFRHLNRLSRLKMKSWRRRPSKSAYNPS